MISAVIIEDEAIHAESLLKKIKEYTPEVNVIKRISTGAEALELLPYITFDLLFLDIELGDMMAFDLIERLKIHDFHIIFVTSFEQYAIKAFKVNAIDYLLKPVNGEELLLAVSKAMRQIFTFDKKHDLMVDYHLSSSRMLCVSDSNFYTYIPCRDILYCLSDGNYTKIYYEESGDEKKMVASRNLLYFEKKLKAYNFLRIHQSVLVNANQIKKIKKHNGELILRNGKIFEIARNRKKIIIEILGK
jgi:two-component system LytT family response regulator